MMRSDGSGVMRGHGGDEGSWRGHGGVMDINSRHGQESLVSNPNVQCHNV